MRTLLYFTVLAAFAVGIAVADTTVTGKWTGTFKMTAQNAETLTRQPSNADAERHGDHRSSRPR